MNIKDSAYPLCRHTKTDGRRCKSPALHTSAFCYFHQKQRRTRRSMIDTGPTLAMTLLETLSELRDARTIQRALSLVAQGIASNRIPPSQAGKMLAALELAVRNPNKAPME